MTMLLIAAASLVNPGLGSALPGPTWAWFGLGALSLVVVIITAVIRLVQSGSGSHGRRDGSPR
jgi:hypothetical protein